MANREKKASDNLGLEHFPKNIRPKPKPKPEPTPKKNDEKSK